jgi:hypothetical protein
MVACSWRRWIGERKKRAGEPTPRPLPFVTF